MVGFKLIDPSGIFDNDAKEIKAIVLKPSKTNVVYQFNQKFRDKPDTIVIYQTDSTPPNQYRFSLGTKFDGILSSSKLIGVQLLYRTGYLVKATESKAEYQVRETNTKISVVPLSAEVERGESASFRILANSKNLSTSGSIEVKLGIEASPSAIYSGQSSRTENLILRNGRVSKDISISTTSDSNTDFELDGLLKVYVKNPDGTSEESFSLPDRGVVLPEGVAVIKVIDDDAPTGISILPLKSHFIEGESAQFQITADESTGSDRTISLMIRPRADFASIVLPATHKSVILSVPTNLNPAQQPSGTVTVTISSGSGYSPAATNSSASVIILDSIVPEFTLASDSVEIIEGQPFDIKINSTPAPKEDYHVFLDFSSGDGGNSNNRATFTPSSHTFMEGQSSLTISGMAPTAITKNYFNVFSVQIQPVDSEQGRGRANLKLPIFILDSAQAPARPKPEVSVTALDSTVFESNMARFEIVVENGNITTVENNRFVSKTADQQSVLVRFQLIETGDVLSDFRTAPQSEDL